MAKPKKTIKNLILDIDGVFTTGQFLYTIDGKFAKVFGAHDHDGIKLIKPYLNIHTITADKRGFKITKKRIVEDMGLKLDIVPEALRLSWLEKNFKLSESIYMGDGIGDIPVFNHVAYSIAPQNAFYLTKKHADYVTKSKSGEGAVAEACLHIIEKFFGPFDIKTLKHKKK